MRITKFVVKPLVGASLVAALLAPSISKAADFDFLTPATGVSNLMSAGASYVGGVAPSGANTDVIRFLDMGNQIFNATNDIAAPLVVNGLVFGFSSNLGTNRISSLGGTANSLQFAGTAPTITVTNFVASGVTNRVFINQQVDLANNLIITGDLQTNNVQLVFASNISGAFGITISNFTASDGNGVNMQAANTYTGGTVIRNGSRVTLSTSNAATAGLGTGTVTMLGANNYLRFTVATNTTFNNTIVIASGTPNGIDSRGANPATGNPGHVRTLNQVDLQAGVLQLTTANRNEFVFNTLNVVSNAVLTNQAPLIINNLVIPTNVTLTLRGASNTVLNVAQPNLLGTINMGGSGNNGGVLHLTNAGTLGSGHVEINAAGNLVLGKTGIGTNEYDLNTDGNLTLAVPDARVGVITAVDNNVNIIVNGGYNSGSNIGASNAGRINLTGITDMTGIPGVDLGRLGAVRGGATELALLDRSANLNAGPLSIIVENSFGDANLVANLGTGAELLRGIAYNTGAVNYAVGTGTAWAGISGDRQNQTLTNGSMTITGTNAVLAHISGSLILGSSNNVFDILHSTPGDRADVYIVGTGGGAVQFNHTNGLPNHSGVSNFIVTSGAQLQPNQAESFGTGANSALGVVVQDGGVLNPGNVTNALSIPVLLQGGSRLDLGDANPNLNGAGMITAEPGAILDLGNASALRTLTQPNNFNNVAGMIVRIGANSISNISVNTDDRSIYEVEAGNRAVADNLIIDGGALINDTASRTFTNTGGLTIGANGAIFAANRGTTLTIVSNLINGAGNNLTIGSTNQILGRNYDGIVALSTGSTSRFAAITVNPGATLNFAGGTGTAYQFTNLFIDTGATGRISTGIIMSNVFMNDGVIDAIGTGNGTRTVTLTGLGGSGRVIMNATNNHVLVVGANGSNSTFTGVIEQSANKLNPLVYTNSGSLRKVGAGTLTLNGTNTYTGLTDVQAGGLIVNGEIAGDLRVTNNTTFGGSASILGSVTAFGNATFAPGNSPGTNVIGGNASFADTVNFNFDLGDSGSDQFQIGGDLALGGVLNINGGAEFPGGTFTLFTYGGTLSTNGAGLTFGTLTGTAAGYNPATDFVLDFDTLGQVNLVVVPEPGTVGLAVLGGVALIGLGIRRRNRK